MIQLNKTHPPGTVEDSGIFKMIDSEDYILMYDLYMSGKYQFCRSRDLQKFEVIDENISMDFHPQHGTVIQITDDEFEELIEKYGPATLSEPSILTDYRSQYPYQIGPKIEVPSASVYNQTANLHANKTMLF